MSSFRKALVFFLLSALFTTKLSRIYGRSLLQRTSPRSEFDCVLTRRELRRFSGGEEGRWLVTDSGLDSLAGDIQTLVNCTEEGDVLLFDVEAPIQPPRRITVPWNLTLSSFIEDPRLGDGTVPEAVRKVTVLCPREDEGVFLVEANETLFANFVFRNCSLSRRRGEEPYGIITTANCSTRQNLGTIAFHHLEFEANFLNRSAALFVQKPSCADLQIVDLRFQNNSCVSTCAANLPTWSEIQNITLTWNRFFEEDSSSPRLITIHSGSSTTVDGIIASGNNGTVFLVSDANLTIRNSHIFQNSGGLSRNGYYTGGVAFLNSFGQILDSRLEENTGHTGSSIAVYNSSSVIRRTRVIGCNATRHGGGISITRSSSVRILDSVIANNSASLTGGGVYSNGTRNLEIENTILVRNSAQTGGGLYFAFGDLEISSSTFRNNSAGSNGAGLYFSRGAISTRDSILTNNRAEVSGGGGFIERNLYSLANLTLIQNEAAYGGGLVMFRSSGSLDDSYFEGNSASLLGGGVNVATSNELVVHNCTFVSNSASFGGGIYGNETMVASLLSCRFVRNNVSVSGAGACFENGTYIIEDNIFEENTSERFGGGLTCFHSRLNVSDTSFLRNNASTSGGGSNVYGNTSAWFANCTWIANTVRSHGGGALFESGPSATITSSSFRLNQAELGGGAYATEANLRLRNVSVNNNTATRSGAVLYFTRSVGTMSNCSFHQNTAIFAGALASYESIIEVAASNFVSNEASSDGGAVQCQHSGNLTLEDCTFASNSANGDGGAVIVSDSMVIATYLRFRNNRASGSGGAVRLMRNATASFSHSQFFGEFSGANGGSISASETELTLTNISIASCYALSGGGVYLSKSSAYINETSVTFCEASESGGGILMILSNVTGSGSNVSFNTAVGTLQYRPEGGGIAVEQLSRLRLRNATVGSNRAQYGAGICARGDCIVSISNGHLYNDSARARGGVAYVRDSSLTLLSVSCMRSNAMYGGAIYIANSSLTLNDSQLINSSSADAGGSILAQGGSTVVMEGTTIQSSEAVNGGGIMLTGSSFRGYRDHFHNCSARTHGGGVGLNESSSFLCTDCLFEGNSALHEGGAIRLKSLTPQMLAFQLEETVFQNNDATFGGAIHFEAGDGSSKCSDVNATQCTFFAMTGCVFTNNHARVAGGAILANNPSAVRLSCSPSNKTDAFAYYTLKKFGTLSELSSLNVACTNWMENNASIYGPIVASYARRLSKRVLLGPNNTVEISGNQYALRGLQSGHPLPTILLEAIDEFSQGPALLQGNRLIEAVMTSPDGLFAGTFTVNMEDSRGNFSGITAFKEPGSYDIHINFSERAMPTLIIVVEIRHCVIGEARAGNGTICQPCGDNTYSFRPLTNEECSACPGDAKCDSVAIRPKKGFWHRTPCSTHLQRCLSERACDEGGRDTRLLELGSSIEDCVFDDEFISNYSDALCREGYTGPLCGSCKASHGKTRSFRCEKCYGRFVNVFLVVLAASVLLALTGFTIRSALPTHRHPATRNQPRREESPSPPMNMQMVEMLWTGVVPPEVIHPHLRRQEVSTNAPSTSQQGQRNADLAKWKALEIFKITINYMQVIAIAISVNVAWTGALIGLFETAEFIGGVTSEAAGRSSDCLISADASIPRSVVRTIVNLIVPVVVGAMLAVFWTVAKVRNQQEYSYLIKRCLLSALVVNYLSYIAITKTAVNILYCVEVHDSFDFENDSTTRYWAVDTALKCYDGSHTVLASVLGWPVLVLFSLGFPVLVACVLIMKRRQEEIQSPWLFESAGFLYRSYDEKFIFWESVILLRKAALAVIVVFAYPLGGNLQGLLAVCVLSIASYLHLLCNPYRSEFETLNRLEGLSLTISSLTFVSGLFLNDDRTSSEAKVAITLAVVLANVGVFIYFSVRFFVAGATYLGIILENEGVPYDQDATAFHIVKTFMRNSFNAHFGPALRRFNVFTYRHHEGSTPNEDSV